MTAWRRKPLGAAEEARRAELARELARSKAISEGQALDVVDTIEKSALYVSRMFPWVNSREGRESLVAEGWAIVLARWAKWDPVKGPPAPFFGQVLAHALKFAIRHDDPRCAWTKSKNIPKRIAVKLQIADSAYGDDGERLPPRTVSIEAVPTSKEALEEVLGGDAEMIRLWSAMLEMCGGDPAELDRVLDAEKDTDPDGVERRAELRREMRTLLECGQYLRLEDPS